MNVSTVLIILTVFTAPSACMDCDIHNITNGGEILSDFITCACQGVDTLFTVRNVPTKLNIKHVIGTRPRQSNTESSIYKKRLLYSL